MHFNQSFDSAFVIQSLGSDEQKTGTEIYETIFRPALANGAIHATGIYDDATPEEVKEALSDIQAKVEENELSPILQLESHGTSSGIACVSGAIEWQDMYQSLVLVNRASRNSMLMCSSMCYGGFGLRASYPQYIASACAFWACIGPSDPVWTNDLLDGFQYFHNALFSGEATTTALDGLIAKVGGTVITISERAFLQAFNYYVDYTLDSKLLQSRVESIHQSTGAPETEVRRRLTCIDGIEEDFYRLRAKHLHIDVHPSIATKFESTFADALRTPG